MAEVEDLKQYEQGEEYAYVDDIDLETLLEFDPAGFDFFAENDLGLVGQAVSDPGIGASLDEVEQFLLDDDVVNGVVGCPDGVKEDDFFAGLFVDSSVSVDTPSPGSVEVDAAEVDVADEGSVLNGDRSSSPGGGVESLDLGVGGVDVVGKEMGVDQIGDLEMGDGGGEDDPLSKKRKRQIRNRDSAMRSRERKKSYVKDLELKSKFMEGECKRLEYLLSCCVAENQILHHQLQAWKANASALKQESAVLPLESLLLGSLFWLLLSMVHFILLPAVSLLLQQQNQSGRQIKNLPHQMGRLAARWRPRAKLETVFALAWTTRKWKSKKWRLKWDSF